MRSPIPLSDLAARLELCENTPLIQAIRAVFLAPGADLMHAADLLPSPTSVPEVAALSAFNHYALHESGRLVNAAARRHHRACFYRCLRLLDKVNK